MGKEESGTSSTGRSEWSSLHINVQAGNIASLQCKPLNAPAGSTGRVGATLVQAALGECRAAARVAAANLRER